MKKSELKNIISEEIRVALVSEMDPDLSIEDQAKIYWLQKLNRGEIDKLPNNPKEAFLHQMMKDQMSHDEETLRRERGLEEAVNEASYKVAGRSVDLIKGKKSDGTDWKVKFKNGKEVALADVLALIKPFPKGITKESVNEASKDEKTLKSLYKQRADAVRKDPNSSLVNSLHKQIEKLVRKMHKGESINETHIGDLIWEKRRLEELEKDLLDVWRNDKSYENWEKLEDVRAKLIDLQDSLDELNEVTSEKQKKWACAQVNSKNRPKGLSKAEAEEMCRSKVKEIIVKTLG